MRKIAVATGTRSEYGILRPLMRLLKKSLRVTLQTVAAGMHLSKEFGHTIDDIAADGFEIAAQVPMLPANDTQTAMALAVGKGIIGFTKAFEKLESDIVVVLGDRIEAFAAATAAVLSGRALAHIHGGDRAEGGYDDYMRHAITKMAHLHFAATHGAARRIARLGERKEQIFTVGAPGLDEIRLSKLPSASVTKKKHGFGPRSPLILAVQHSISTHPETAAAEMRETLAALEALSLPTVLVWPNSDAGGRSIIKEIEGLNGAAWLRTYRSLPRMDFLELAKAATVMVGNSSSGIIEAASLSLAVVNVGRRQAGRERSGNTVDVPHERKRIEGTLRKIIENAEYRKRLTSVENVYGDGKASARIVDILESVEIGPELLVKRITY